MKIYASPVAFRTALNAKLRSRARAMNLPVNRVRTLAVMERFLARVVAVFPPTTVLKGGLALELRLEKACTTVETTCGSWATRVTPRRWSTRRPATSPSPTTSSRF